MITRRIVLVLGAGASIPFGFPSGLELKVEIVNRLSPPNPDAVAFGLLTQAGFEMGHIEEFRTALQKSGKLSVDAFLEHRVEFLEVGKAATVCFLMRREIEQALFGGQLSWYDYFFNRLNADFEEFSRNCVSVVTFNYDRSLEHYLLTALKNSYGKGSEECAQTLRSVPIVHLYGQLGELPSLSNDGNGIEFGARLSVESLRRAANGIHIVHEASLDSEPFKRAHDLLEHAERVCFLGFGYDETNVKRLMGFSPIGPLEIYGSAKGLTAGECQLIEGRLKGLGFKAVRSLEYLSGDALQFLRIRCPFD